VAYSEAQKIWHAAHKEQKREYDRAYRAANKEKRAAAKKREVEDKPHLGYARKARYRAAHRDELRMKGIQYNRDNAEARAEYLSRYQKQNPDKLRMWSMNYRAAKIQRTPTWLTEDDHWMIEQAYAVAVQRTKTTGVMWHVDHIIPLQGTTVSGLHVPWNMQVITETENKRKGNRLQYDPA
jgi:5-methylcytosine-specific restriction endonuclease McrA